MLLKTAEKFEKYFLFEYDARIIHVRQILMKLNKGGVSYVSKR